MASSASFSPCLLEEEETLPCELPMSSIRGSAEEQGKERCEVQRGTGQTADIDAEETSIQGSLQVAGVG